MHETCGVCLVTLLCRRGVDHALLVREAVCGAESGVVREGRKGHEKGEVCHLYLYLRITRITVTVHVRFVGGFFNHVCVVLVVVHNVVFRVRGHVTLVFVRRIRVLLFRGLGGFHGIVLVRVVVVNHILVLCVLVFIALHGLDASRGATKAAHDVRPLMLDGLVLLEDVVEVIAGRVGGGCHGVCIDVVSWGPYICFQFCWMCLFEYIRVRQMDAWIMSERGLLTYVTVMLPFDRSHPLAMVELAMDVVESLYLSASDVTSRMVKDACLDLCVPGERALRIPFYYPRDADVDVRARLWGRGVSMTLMTLMAPRAVDPIQAVMRATLRRHEPRVPTASSKEVAQIPLVEFKTLEGKKRKRGEERDKCVICLTAFQSNSKVKRLQCGHTFHGKCLDKALKKTSRVCCICRAPVDFEKFAKRPRVAIV